MQTPNFRLQIWYSGRVQGVGFRFKAVQVSKGYDIVGTVSNLDDGRVHLIAVGKENEVREFANQLAYVMKDFIKDTQELADTTEKKYKGFIIEL